jgi:hypothetical protein
MSIKVRMKETGEIRVVPEYVATYLLDHKKAAKVLEPAESVEREIITSQAEHAVASPESAARRGPRGR